MDQREERHAAEQLLKAAQAQSEQYRATIEDTAKLVHSVSVGWMTKQEYTISPSRMRWETMAKHEQDLYRTVARRVIEHLGESAAMFNAGYDVGLADAEEAVVSRSAPGLGQILAEGIRKLRKSE